MATGAGGAAKSTYKAPPPCHVGFKEVVPGLLVGKEYDVFDAVSKGVDVLIPLAHLGADIFSSGFLGDILHLPIPDMGVMPEKAYDHYSSRVAKMIEQGARVAIFCLGGHGRTGLFAGAVLGKLGKDDPIGLLRSDYCSKAVESSAQVTALSTLLGHPEWVAKYPPNKEDYAVGAVGDTWGIFDSAGYGGSSKKAKTCGGCAFWASTKQHCNQWNRAEPSNAVACNKFVSFVQAEKEWPGINPDGSRKMPLDARPAKKASTKGKTGAKSGAAAKVGVTVRTSGTCTLCDDLHPGVVLDTTPCDDLGSNIFAYRFDLCSCGAVPTIEKAGEIIVKVFGGFTRRDKGGRWLWVDPGDADPADIGAGE